MTARFFSILAGALLAGTVAQAQITFTGAYDASNWTLTTNGGTGSVDTSLTSQIVLTGSDNGTEIPEASVVTSFTITAPASGTVSFDWNYQSNDNYNSPSFDQFGYEINGVQTQLSDNFGGVSQTGSISFAVTVGQTFGFYIDATDNSTGDALTTITNFDGPVAVPEASTLGFVLAGLFVPFALIRRRR